METDFLRLNPVSVTYKLCDLGQTLNLSAALPHLGSGGIDASSYLMCCLENYVISAVKYLD